MNKKAWHIIQKDIKYSVNNSFELFVFGVCKKGKGSEYDRKFYHPPPKSNRKEVACPLRYYASESYRKSPWGPGTL